MLRQPRKLPKHKHSNLRQQKKLHTPSIDTRGSVIYLTKPAKITWIHFEALRLKFARTITAKRKTSRRAWFKQQKKQEQQRQAAQARAPKIKKKSLVWYSGFPHHPYYSKGRGNRMGKGKGGIKNWYFKAQAHHKLLVFKHSNYRLLLLFAHRIKRLLPCDAYIRRQPYKSFL